MGNAAPHQPSPAAGLISLTDKEFNTLTSFVKQKYGIDLTKKRVLIESRLSSELGKRGFTSFRQYLDAVKTQTEELYQDYSITYSEAGEREVCGLQFSEMSYVVDYSGATLHQTYLVRKIDNRMYGIILSYAGEAALDSLLAGFSAY